MAISDWRKVGMIKADDFGICELEARLVSDVARDAIGMGSLDDEALGGFGARKVNVGWIALEICKRGCGG